MVKSKKIYSPSEYLTLVTGNYHNVTGLDDIKFIEDTLESYDLCLWNYPLEEIDHISNENLDVVLVECFVFNEKTNDFDREYRWFEFIPTETDVSKFYIKVTETFTKTIAIVAPSLEEAEKKAKDLYEKEILKVSRKECESVQFELNQQKTEDYIQHGIIAEKDIETF